MGELGQDRPEGAITLAGCSRALLARTFIIPWCHPGPCGQARCGLKARHIDPDLRQVVFQKWRWSLSYCPSKSIAVDKQADDEVVHLYRFREADGLADQ